MGSVDRLLNSGIIGNSVVENLDKCFFCPSVDRLLNSGIIGNSSAL